MGTNIGWLARRGLAARVLRALGAVVATLAAVLGTVWLVTMLLKSPEDPARAAESACQKNGGEWNAQQNSCSYAGVPPI